MQIRDRIIELRRVKASELIPNPKNWRTHPKAQLDAMRGVLAEIGFAGAELAYETDRGLMLIDGHARAEIAGESEIPVLILDVTEAEATKILATFDPIGAMATADAGKLDAILREVETGSEALAAMLTELAKDNGLLDELNKGSEVTEDEVPEPPVDPITKPGDLWILGKHRVLCGDSTKAEDVGRLMDGAKADLCFTSPPYNAGVVITDGKHAKKYQDIDDKQDATSYLHFLQSFFDCAFQVSEYVFINIQMLSGNKESMIRFLYENLDKYADCVVWDKSTAEPAMPRKVTNSRFEFVHVFSKKANRAIGVRDFRGDVDNVLVLNSRQDKEHSQVHKATFPVAFPCWFFSSFSNKGSIAYEPFCGTGTTLIAAEQLGRTCYGMEISPQYCDVIVKRWENLTGQKAILETKCQSVTPD